MAGLVSDNNADFEYYTDAFAGGYDGFFDAINPFDAFLSMPDVGAINGNDGAYTIGYVGGTVVGIVTSTAISSFGPGLVQCGTFGARVMKAWEFADAVAIAFAKEWGRTDIVKLIKDAQKKRADLN